MKHKWTSDPAFPQDTDLSVQDVEGHWIILAFIRWDYAVKQYKCRFMSMEDGKYPDGEAFKTKRGAQRFCTKHLPVMWIRFNTPTGDNA